MMALKMAAPLSMNLKQVKCDLIRANVECSQRGLLYSVKWLSELSFSLGDVGASWEELKSVHSAESPQFMKEFDRYSLAKSYFDLREYDRAAFFTEGCQSEKAKFLHLYSRYMSGEKKRNDDMAESQIPGAEAGRNQALKSLRSELQKDHLEKKLDGYALFLYGAVLKKLDMKKMAVDIFLEAIQAEPFHWGAWLELAVLIPDKDKLNLLELPDVWVKQFFLAQAYLELQLNDEALEIYNQLRDCGFSNSTYITAQIAISYHNMRNVDKAVCTFQKLRKIDPYRLDNMDTYSNLLYVKELRVELSYLAHQLCDIDKYCVETCCVVGNYYSLRSQHERAVLYFQRALKLNPNYLSAWTLMGHEYMEMKNTSAAIQSYRQAIEVNRRDYRAWYGLGQTYELLKMHYYCLYYYRQAQQLRPNDSRMLVALGESYEKLDKLIEAKRCFWKAHIVGDVEGMALVKLAKLYARSTQEKQAVAAYSEYIAEAEEQGVTDRDDMCHAYKYLADYYLKSRSLDEAYDNAQKCTEYKETREEGNAILRQIAHLRTVPDAAMQPESAILPSGMPRTLQGELILSSYSPMNLNFTP